MKIKVIFLIVLSILFIFTGCSNQKYESDANSQLPTNINGKFKASATVRFSNMEALINLNKQASNTYSVEFIQPKSLKGMTLNFIDDEIKISFLGINVTLGKDSFLTSAMVNALINSINKVSNETGLTISKKGDNLIIDSESESGKFKMILDKKSGSILEISMPSIDLECTFGDFKYE